MAQTNVPTNFKAMKKIICLFLLLLSCVVIKAQLLSGRYVSLCGSQFVFKDNTYTFTQFISSDVDSEKTISRIGHRGYFEIQNKVLNLKLAYWADTDSSTYISKLDKSLNDSILYVNMQIRDKWQNTLPYVTCVLKDFDEQLPLSLISDSLGKISFRLSKPKLFKSIIIIDPDHERLEIPISKFIGQQVNLQISLLETHKLALFKDKNINKTVAFKIIEMNADSITLESIDKNKNVCKYKKLDN
jgi:hypothetical protein